MGSAANDFSNDARALREQAEASASRVGESAGRTADDAREELARLRAQVERLMQDRVTPVLGSAADTVEDYSRRARETVEENVYALSDTVRERPLLAIAAAAVAGYLLGRLMGGNTYVYPDRH